MRRHGNSRYARCVAETLETRTLMTAQWTQGVWQISSETNLASDTDTIEIHYSENNPALLEAYINGQLADARPVAKLKAIRITGSDRNDLITADFGASPAFRCVVFAKAGNDQITTGAANDNVLGGQGDDTISLGDGRDLALGGRGSDTLFGGPGRDFLNGNTDTDTIDGGDGNDIVHGGAGDDLVVGGLGHDLLDGGQGKNRIRGARLYDHIVRRKGDVVDLGNGTNSLNLATDAELKQLLIDAAVEQYKSLFGNTFTRYPWYSSITPIYTITLNNSVSGGLTFMSTDAAATPAALSSNDYSGTNNQVTGVEEADYIKTDGDYVYILKYGTDGAELTVVRTVDPDNPTVVSRTTVEGSPRAIFLHGDRVTVITSIWEHATSALNRPWYWWGQDQTIVTTLDVSSHESPEVMESTRIDGSYRDARETAGELYLVLGCTNPRFPMPRSTLVETGAPGQPPEFFPIQLAGSAGLDRAVLSHSMPYWGGTSETYRYETEAEYRAHLASIIDEYMPLYTVTDASGAMTTLSLLQGDLFVPETIKGSAMTTIVNIGLLDAVPGIDDMASTFGFSSEVYASTDAMYLSATSWSNDDNGTWRPSTDLYKFDLGPGVVDFSATGVVPGNVLNQFSMDEYAGYFRVATTTWGIEGWSDTSNGVYVLEQTGDSLGIVGAVDQLARGERIESVRFVEDRAFVVTFRQVDPLFALDLSDPLKPVVKGELKIPGFSSYLQMIDDTHLLGIGTSEGTNGWLQGLQLSVFDVSNMANPKVVEQLPIDIGGWTTSQARWDSHAVSWFDEAGILVIPISGWTEKGWTNGFREYRIGPESGFEYLGMIEHADWGGYRSLRINDRVYTISNQMLKVSQLGAPGNLIAQLALET